MLPYEQQLARKPEPAAPAQAGTPAPAQAGMPAATPSEHAVAPSETATVKAAPEPDAKAEAAAPQSAEPPGANAENAGQSSGQAVPPAEDADANDGTAMTPDDGVDPAEQAAMPPDDGARSYDDGQRPYDVTAVPPGSAPPGAYGDAPAEPYGPPPAYARSPRDALYGGPPSEGPYGGPPPQGPYGGPAPQGPYGDALQGAYGDAPPGAYGQGPDGAQQGAPGAPQEEWVIVLVSGAGMRATAADDAPMLFAFPYGRNLRVVSHYENWVEVTDPKSAATGWMKEAEVSPIAPPGSQPPQTEAYDEQPQGQGGWFRRRQGGLADMINRALGGGFLS